MKRIFPAVLGVCLILAALLVPDTLTDLDYQTLTVFENGRQTVYAAGDAVPSTRGKYVRVDMTGDAETVLKRLGARERFREQLDDSLTVIYAFSARFSAHETVHGQTVNLMIAVRNDRLAVGSPLLKGSY